MIKILLKALHVHGVHGTKQYFTCITPQYWTPLPFYKVSKVLNLVPYEQSRL